MARELAKDAPPPTGEERAELRGAAAGGLRRGHWDAQAGSALGGRRGAGMKRCNGCDLVKPVTAFAWRVKDRGWRLPNCDPCDRARQKRGWVARAAL